uniref:Z14/Z16 acylCoA desaturase n=1 Tax=Chauliognathus lugubris TaxID=1184608 RepID=K7PBV4_9COLE|nr:Z14/Z16 acylCoA desaturase [Chauliognathus lugubris]
MPPQVTGVLYENDEEVTGEAILNVQKNITLQKLPIIWSIVIKHAVSHIISFYGLYLAFTSASWLTLLYGFVNYVVGCLGATAGVHRLWCHRSYKARWPLRLFLAYGQTQNFHMDIIYWSRVHRVHHRYTETDADPTNAKRGMVYAHIGWTYQEETDDFKEKFQATEVPDIEADPIAKFQQKYYKELVILICYVIPTVVPMYFWNESFANALSVNFLRYSLNLHSFFFVNSIAHWLGNKPYEKSIEASENLFVSTVLLGEGWHNYHHTFPWDYRTGEMGRLNLSASFIYLMSKLGLAYDLKTVTPEMLKRRIQKSGDGSHEMWGPKSE